MPGHFRKIPRVLPPAHKAGQEEIVPKIPRPGHAEPKPKTTGAHRNLSIAMRGSEHELQDFPAFYRTGGKRFFIQAIPDDADKERWIYNYHEVDEQGNGLESTHYHASENYGAPELALQAARKRIAAEESEQE